MTKRYLFGLLLAMLIAAPIAAQETTEPQRTSVPPEARFEIIQSHIAAKFTVRLDKYTGITYQLVKKANGDMTWQVMDWVGILTDTNKVPGRVNYQIFTSGLTLRDTFLININTGATFQLFHDTKEGEDFWAPIQ